MDVASNLEKLGVFNGQSYITLTGEDFVTYSTGAVTPIGKPWSILALLAV